jgi:hypothetical protein
MITNGQAPAVSSASMTAVCGKCGTVYWKVNGHSCSRRLIGSGLTGRLS